jgi:malate permease and related proteins
MAIATTIVPIFAIIGVGWVARSRGFLPETFVAPANRLVYYWAIPAMIFRSISGGSFETDFNPEVLFATLTSVVFLFFMAWTAGLLWRIEKNQLGPFVQSSFHGNLGYIGLAVVFYHLGEDGLAKAGILAGFVMILQNFLAVLILSVYANRTISGNGMKSVISGIFSNPVILSAMAGIAVSWGRIEIPGVLDKSLKILSGMALPLALLLIGASLSFELIRHKLAPALLSSLLKLAVLPGTGFLLYKAVGATVEDFLPGLILLAAPAATLVYVMAVATKSDAEFAVADISLSTLLSAPTFAVWIMVAAWEAA